MRTEVNTSDGANYSEGQTDLKPSQAIDALQEKRVFVTGHTGFKGSWLSLWLQELGARVHGYSLSVPTSPALFDIVNVSRSVETTFGDVRNPTRLYQALEEFQPEVIFHLAAQPIVRESVSKPLDTFTTNAIGTAQVLDYIRLSQNPPILVVVTSDKVYQNNNWPWGYRETDQLSQQDPYSASKAMAETVVASFLYTYGDSGLSAGVSVGRAGNVIGGGDFAESRLIPDVYRAIARKAPLSVRSLDSTRPWQHVLEPLSGYLTLAGNLIEGTRGIHGEAFNFGPKIEKAQTVGSVLEAFQNYLNFEYTVIPQAPNQDFSEAHLLQLDWSKASSVLSWRPVLSFDETLSWTGKWYKQFIEDFSDEKSLRSLTLDQLAEYRARI